MSELSPLSAARLGELALEAGIPPGCSTSCTGFWREAGEPLCRHRRCAAISFTGSIGHGKPHRESFGPEEILHGIGGKSPLSCSRADLPRALDAALFMIFSTTATLYRGFAHPGCRNPFTRVRREVHRRARRIVVGESASTTRHHRAMISAITWKSPALYRDGPQGGGRMMCGGVERPSWPRR